ncbi:MAG: globin domain-containing protein [Gammaproteobacteria bacterium]
MTASHLSERDHLLVTESFRRIEPVFGLAGRIFHDRLWTLAPELEHRMGGEAATHREMFMEVMSLFTSALADAAHRAEALRILARWHARHGIRSADLQVMEDAFVWMLHQAIGDGLNAEQRQAWRAAFAIFASGLECAIAEERLQFSTEP